MHSLNAEVGKLVASGEVLCSLADHRALYIEGHAFKKDIPLIQQATRNRLPVEVDFEGGDDSAWPQAPTNLQIHHVANTVDEQSRTFAFYLALENQWQTYTRDGQERLLWRYRPGDRLRLSVAVDELKDVYVLPKAAVISEGAETYVFRQNGDFFDRRPVHVLHRDSTFVVIASDSALKPGHFVAQNAAATLNRVLKAQMSSGMPTNVHVHADGTVHAAH
jgi:multidrug efflux pump subunit AcrA (membrane-fusion protein)